MRGSVTDLRFDAPHPRVGRSTAKCQCQEEKGRWLRHRRRAREREVVNKAIVADIHILHGDIRAADRSRKRCTELRPRGGAGRRSRENQGAEGSRARRDANHDSARETRQLSPKKLQRVAVFYRPQTLTVTRRKVAGMEVPPLVLVFSDLASSRSWL